MSTFPSFSEFCSVPIIRAARQALVPYGLSENVLQRWHAAFAGNVAMPVFDADAAIARVMADFGTRYQVISTMGEATVEIAAGRLKQAGQRPVVGDWVLLMQHDNMAFITEVLPRTSQLSRNAAGQRTEEQIIAANVDRVWIVMGLDGDFNPARLERWVTAVWQSGATPWVVLTKADQCATPDRFAAQAMGAAPGVELHIVSAVTGAGVDELQATLPPGCTLVLVGSSGAGKSTLANALMGADVMRTGAVRTGDDRGRHTTTHRQLFQLPGGALLIDGPGMREVQLWAGEAALDEAFHDITQWAQQCHFSDCQHGNEPGCAVQLALSSGALEQRRFQRWQQLRDEIQRHEIRRDAVARRQHERRQGKLYQSIKNAKQDRKRRF